MRVRKFSNRGSTTKVIGKFPSLKTGKTVWWESQLERDLIYLLESDSDVLAYREQPLRIPYTLDGRRHSYTPDFLVERKGEQQIVEVKYEEDAARSENIRLFNVIAPLCREEGHRFVVATEREIRVQPRLDNIKLLSRYSRALIDPQQVVDCYRLMRRGTLSRLADAFEFFESKGVTRAVVYALIYRGDLKVDLMQPLNAETMILPVDVDFTCYRKVS